MKKSNNPISKSKLGNYPAPVNKKTIFSIPMFFVSIPSPHKKPFCGRAAASSVQKFRSLGGILGG
ncbi:MAG: hypothetical protein D6707_10090 [Bacteroidetes bacterium]|nr:MAG: hypothetical protein D6707_10090 [Bacteroidota bacterium]